MFDIRQIEKIDQSLSIEIIKPIDVDQGQRLLVKISIERTLVLSETVELCLEERGPSDKQ